MECVSGKGRESVYFGQLEKGVPDAVTGLGQTWEGDTGLCDQEELSGACSSEPLRRCDQLSAPFQGLVTAWLFPWGQLDRSSHV